MAEVNGRPFLACLLDRLADAGIKRVVLCTGYMAELIHETFGESYHNMSLFYSQEDTPLGTAGALRKALPLITSDPALVMNGDSFCDANLEQFIRWHDAATAFASFVTVQVEDVSRYGTVNTNSENRVVRFSEKGNNHGIGMINAGIYLISKDIITSIPPERAVSLEQDIFPSLIGNGLTAFPCHGRFIDIGIPADYYAASSVLADHI
jgi:D-glycero-alpha-D-manno-heptose 1-phosphate guanylyltransferase